MLSLSGMKTQDKEGMRTYRTVSSREKGLGPGSAGQSGDTQGLSDVAEAGGESVEELVEEGQNFEAEAIGGVEDAPDADVAEVHTKEVPEDDVPGEYRGGDQGR
jgi:N utilization substance protein A